MQFVNDFRFSWFIKTHQHRKYLFAAEQAQTDSKVLTAA
jgi:hypothetical protein